jgi:hypothetical protein
MPVLVRFPKAVEATKNEGEEWQRERETWNTKEEDNYPITQINKRRMIKLKDRVYTLTS